MIRKHKHSRLRILLATSLIAGGGLYFLVTSAPVNSLKGRDIAKDVFGSDENLEFFTSSEVMVARRLTHLDHDFTRLENYQMGSEILVPQASADEIRNLLNQDSSYVWEYSKACIPDYGILLTVRDQKGKEIHIAICFECLILSVFDGNDLMLSEDFDPIHIPLIAIIKPLFPDDPEIQALR